MRRSNSPVVYLSVGILILIFAPQILDIGAPGEAGEEACTHPPQQAALYELMPLEVISSIAQLPVIRCNLNFRPSAEGARCAPGTLLWIRCITQLF